MLCGIAQVRYTEDRDAAPAVGQLGSTGVAEEATSSSQQLTLLRRQKAGDRRTWCVGLDDGDSADDGAFLRHVD